MPIRAINCLNDCSIPRRLRSSWEYTIQRCNCAEFPERGSTLFHMTIGFQDKKRRQTFLEMFLPYRMILGKNPRINPSLLVRTVAKGF
jgi:hypothetical protein